MLVLALDLTVSTKFSTVLYISKCSQEENQGLSTLEEIITFHTPLLCHPSPTPHMRATATTDRGSSRLVGLV